MTPPLLSVLIPSKFRFDKLKRAIESWEQCTRYHGNLEVIVGLDQSDQESVARIGELQFPFPVKVYQDRDKLPLEPSCWLWNKIKPHATGIWHQYWSDDMTIYGTSRWDEELAKVATTGLIVQPEFHKLGGSLYPKDSGGPVPFIPASCYEALGIPQVPEPPDTGLETLLRIEHGWKHHFLQGVGVFHDREADRTLKNI